MTKSLFQQYEEERRMFSPGTIFKTTIGSGVWELMIIGKKGYEDQIRYEDDVMIEILKIEQPSVFNIGERYCASKSYIKRNYKPKYPV